MGITKNVQVGSRFFSRLFLKLSFEILKDLESMGIFSSELGAPGYPGGYRTFKNSLIVFAKW